MASGTGLPPKTLEEVDALIDEIVKARLIDRLAGSAKENDASRDDDSNAASPDSLSSRGSSPSQVDRDDDFSHAEGRPGDTGHDGEKKKCLCAYCNPEKSISAIQLEHPGTLSGFQRYIDEQAARTLAVLESAQSQHQDGKRVIDPSEWLEWYAQLFAAVIAICSLGAGFTFTILFSGIEVPDQVENGTYTDNQQKSSAEAKIVRYIRNCLAVSWMLFVFAIGTTTFIALMINTVKGQFIADVRTVEQGDGRWGRKPLLLTISCSTLLVQELPVGAFLASAEALRQYNQGVGIVSLVGTGIAGLIVAVAWSWQNV
jgi:hypothetical protein